MVPESDWEELKKGPQISSQGRKSNRLSWKESDVKIILLEPHRIPVIQEMCVNVA